MFKSPQEFKQFLAGELNQSTLFYRHSDQYETCNHIPLKIHMEIQIYRALLTTAPHSCSSFEDLVSSRRNTKFKA